MKTAFLALVLTTAVPSHVTFAVLGLTISLSVLWLVLTAEATAVVTAAWLAIRALRRFRSSPFPRHVSLTGCSL